MQTVGQRAGEEGDRAYWRARKETGRTGGRGRRRGVLESEDLQQYRRPQTTGKARDEEDDSQRDVTFL